MSTFESVTSVAYGNRTDTTVNKPAGAAIGDHLLLLHNVAANDPGVTSTPPSGFSSLPDTTGDTPNTWPLAFGQSGYTIRCYAWDRVVDGSEGSSFTITHAAADTNALCVRVSGADATPFDPAPTRNYSQSFASAADTVFLGFTTVKDNTLVLVWNVDWGDTANNLTPPAGSTPTFTERFDASITYLATGNLATAGATGDRTMANNANTTNPWAGHMIAMKPADAAVVDRDTDHSRFPKFLLRT